MSKDVKQLQATLRRLDSAQQKPAIGLQRRFQRFPVRGEARLWPGQADSTSEHSSTVQVRDISRGGAGLLASEPVEQGCFWQMQIVDGGLSIITLPAFCRYSREVADGAYLIGVEFGVEASVMLALGVPPKELAAGDEAENRRPLTGDFLDPGALLQNEAA